MIRISHPFYMSLSFMYMVCAIGIKYESHDVSKLGIGISKSNYVNGIES